LTVNYVLFSERKEDVLGANPWLSEVNVTFGNVCYEGRAEKLAEKRLSLASEKLAEWDSPCSWESKAWPSVPAIFPDGRINFCCYFGLKSPLSLGNLRNTALICALRGINKNPALVALFKHGPVKLAMVTGNVPGDFKTYGKCGFCNKVMEGAEKDVLR